MSYSYRLPRKYRYRGGSDNRGMAIGAVIVAVAVLGAAQHGKAAAVIHGHGAAGIPAHAAVYAPAGSNEALANQMAASGYGWTGALDTCLVDLWTHECGFYAYAANPTSNARGIPQNINGWSASYQPGNASQQITWGLNYIAGRYGNPCAAWAFEMSHYPNWY